MDKLSVTIIVQNEEDKITECLESVDWADEIIVVDGGSTDGTVAICESYSCRIFQNPWPGYALQKQFALDRAVHPWVLSLDADERISTPLKAEILSILRNPPADVDGYRIPRLSMFLNRPIRHGGWYPGYQLRLFRKGKTHVHVRRVHEGFIVDGRCSTLNAPILHFTHDSIESSLRRMNTYSTLEALDRFDRHPNRRIRWYHILIHPLSAFVRQYIAKRGFLDGIHGWLLATITAIVKFALYSKIWERQRLSAPASESPVEDLHRRAG